MHYMCKCVFVFAPLLCALSLTHSLSPSFFLPLSLARSLLLAVAAAAQVGRGGGGTKGQENEPHF